MTTDNLHPLQPGSKHTPHPPALAVRNPLGRMDPTRTQEDPATGRVLVTHKGAGAMGASLFLQQFYMRSDQA